MNTFKQILPILAILILFSCKKETVKSTADVTAINIVNAMPTSGGLVANINNKLPQYLNAASVGYASSQLFTFEGGSTSLVVKDQSDTTKTIFNQSVSLQGNTIYSLFLAGTIDAPDPLLITDQLLTLQQQDSAAGIRFVNLSTGADAVSVNITGSDNGSEAGSLSYKDITAFKKYAATSAIGSYSFEFRDAANGTLLASYTINGVNNGTNGNLQPNMVRARNLTIALIGEPGNQMAVQFNNF